VTADRWAELRAFFGPSGAYSSCWCTFWRIPRRDFEAGCRDGGAGNRAVLRRLTLDGDVPGLLARDAGRPVGWVTVGPREAYPVLGRSATLKPADPDEPGVWLVPCFWVPRAHRGQGVATALLAGAVEYAAAQGAAVVEGYPVQADGRVPPAEAYTGTTRLFRRAGFRLHRRPDRGRRIVMRRRLS
jgi:GNAT superfamily N-acetyltransferase